jgi:glycogen debranching enzyme
MKTRNTLENKAKFFAQYWGQKVLSDISNSGNTEIYPVDASNMYGIDRSYLELKPLSQITDEDAVMLGYTDSKSAIDKHFKMIGQYTIDADYLRSKGYALPWMDLSVEDLVEYGWIKLKEN